FVGSPVGRPPSPAPFPYTTLFRSAALGFDGNSPEPRIPAVQDVLHGFEVPQQYVRDGVSRRDPEWLRAEHRSGQPHDQEAVGVGRRKLSLLRNVEPELPTVDFRRQPYAFRPRSFDSYRFDVHV